MATPTTSNGNGSRARSASRDLRDAWWFRIAAVVVVLGFAGLVARGCGSAGREISQDRAVQLAEAEASFTPDRHQIRFLQRGVPPHPYWGVSLYNVGENGRVTKVELYLVDAETGKVSRAG